MESLLDDLKDELSDVPSPRATPVPETITNGKRRISDAGANLSYRSTKCAILLSLVLAVQLIITKPAASRQTPSARA